MSTDEVSGRSLRAKPKQKESFDPSPADASPKRKTSVGKKALNKSAEKEIINDENVCPTTICLERDTKNWIGCDKCPQWYHLDCAQNISKITINQDEDWICPKCKPSDFNHDISEVLPQLQKKLSSKPPLESQVVKTRKIEQAAPNPSAPNTGALPSQPSPTSSGYAKTTSFPIGTTNPNSFKPVPTGYPPMGPKSGTTGLTPISQPYPYRFTPFPSGAPNTNSAVIPPPPSALSQPPSTLQAPPATSDHQLHHHQQQSAPDHSEHQNQKQQPPPAQTSNVPPPTLNDPSQNTNSASSEPPRTTVAQPPSELPQPHQGNGQ